MGQGTGYGLGWRPGSGRARAGARALLAAIAAVASFAVLAAGPASAGGLSGGATLVDGSHTYAGVVVAGTDAWAYAPGGCAGNASDGYLYEFDQYGARVASVDLGPGLCDVSEESIATNGTYAAVANGDSLELVDLSTLAVTTVVDTLPLVGLGPVHLVLTSSLLDVSVGSYWTGSYSLAGTPVRGLFPEFLPEVDASASDGTNLYQVGAALIASWTLASSSIFPDNLEPFVRTAPGSSLVVDGTTGYVTTALDGSILEVDLTTLTMIDQSTIPGATDLTAMALSGGDLWVADGATDALFEVDPTTLTVVRTVSLSSAATSVAGEGGVIFAVESDGALVEVDQPVLFQPSTTTLSAPSGSPVVGSSETLTASVSTPGAVTFSDDGVAIPGCTALAATTSVTCTWTPTGVGAQEVTASLAPTSSTYLPSTSAPLALVVAPAASTVSASVASFHVTTDVATAPYGPVTLVATASTPGTVTFSVAGSPVTGCVGVPAPSSSATCVLHPSAPGTLSVTASLAPYSANYQVSSATLTVRVVPGSAALAVGPFAPGSAALSGGARRATEALARLVARDGYTHVALVGSGGAPGGAPLGGRRAAAVAAALTRDLAALGDTAVSVATRAVSQGAGAGVEATASF